VQRHTLSFIPHHSLHGHLMPSPSTIDVPDAVDEDAADEQVCDPDDNVAAYNDYEAAQAYAEGRLQVEREDASVQTDGAGGVSVQACADAADRDDVRERERHELVQEVINLKNKVFVCVRLCVRACTCVVACHPFSLSLFVKSPA
jgi:hypothetical protein